MGLYILKYPYRRVLEPLARSLAWVDPDILSYAATVVAGGTAVAYYFASSTPTLLLVAIGLILLRMTLNTLDGVIAIQRGKTALVGEIVNALPDRFSDIFLMLGIALSPLCHPAWGLLGLAAMLVVSYAGMLGKAVGVQLQHHGPLGKVERLILVIAFSLVQFLHLQLGWRPWTVLRWTVTPLEACMFVFVLLGLATVLNRTRGMVREIHRLEWRRRCAGGTGLPRVLVAYDSITGNTEKVAFAIAESMQAEVKRIEDVSDVRVYDLVVVGSPVMSSKPTVKVSRFLQANSGLTKYAVFVTYGAPVIGPWKVRRALRHLERLAGGPPRGRFVCKGRHALVNTYKGHPNDEDLLGAFLFGMGLARSMEVRR